MPSGNGVEEEFSVIDIIRAKRDKKELTENQIKSFIAKLSGGSSSRSSNGDGGSGHGGGHGGGGGYDEHVHEAQVGAFLMAVFLNGLSANETIALTKAMTYSGYVFQWPKHWKGTVVDKHSTGGIGDKTSLVLAPALAACGLRVPMVSGRGLDFTGGTLDKLESIPQFSVSLSSDQMHKVLEEVGCCIVGQTRDLVPADKIMYSIRDTTATVDYENLIVASIISKKAAENLDALVLDIKVGSGALMKDFKKAKSLAENLVRTGNSFGMKVTGVMTGMDSPLGKAVGNALEVAEAIDTLNNKGPQDLFDLVVLLGAKLLESTEQVTSLEEGKRQIAGVIQDGRALSKFQAMIVAQGTDPKVAKEICHGDKWKYLPKAKCVTNLYAKRSGFVETIDALTVGRVCHSLGCGRSGPGLAIKHEPGIVLNCKPGDVVTQDDVTMYVHHDGSEHNLKIIQRLADAVMINNNDVKIEPLVLEVID